MTPEARNWLMLWHLRGSPDTIPWEEFCTMPEEAFDYFPAGPENLTMHTYIRTVHAGASITLIRQCEQRRVQCASHSMYAWKTNLVHGALVSQPCLYKVVVERPGTWSKRAVWAETFQAAILKAIRFSAKEMWVRDA